MLAEAELDMVLITTPIPLHFANAMTAIAAGKHVYVQKSMTVTMDEANALLAARDEAGIKLVAAPGFDLFPITLQMRELVQGGMLGKVAAGHTYAIGFGHEHEGIRTGGRRARHHQPDVVLPQGRGAVAGCDDLFVATGDERAGAGDAGDGVCQQADARAHLARRDDHD